MRSLQVFILSLTLLASSSCDKRSTAPTALGSSGWYVYTGYDSSAIIVATGTMYFARLDSVIAGERNLTGSGPEAGSGPFSGSISSYGTITIRFPSQQIGGLYLRGNQTDSHITGERYLDIGARFPGIKVGTFRIIPAFLRSSDGCAPTRARTPPEKPAGKRTEQAERSRVGLVQSATVEQYAEKRRVTTLEQLMEVIFHRVCISPLTAFLFPPAPVLLGLSDGDPQCNQERNQQGKVLHLPKERRQLWG